jgi:hypothetical protein
VLQHPRCQNCHIPGEAPLQFDEGLTHSMNVQRGSDGHGPAGLECGTCHADQNPPASYGPHMPPGALNWHLPPADQKMVFIGLSAAELCKEVKDPTKNGGRDLQAMFEHMRDDQLVSVWLESRVGREPCRSPGKRLWRSSRPGWTLERRARSEWIGAHHASAGFGVRFRRSSGR